MKKLIVLLAVLCALGGCKKENSDASPQNPFIGTWYLEYTMDSAKTMKIPYYEYQSEQPYLVFGEDTIVRYNTRKLNNIFGGAFCFLRYSYSMDSIKLLNDNINYQIKEDTLYLYGKYSWGMIHISCVYFDVYPNYWYCIFSKSQENPSTSY